MFAFYVRIYITLSNKALHTLAYQKGTMSTSFHTTSSRNSLVKFCTGRLAPTFVGIAALNNERRFKPKTTGFCEYMSASTSRWENAPCLFSTQLVIVRSETAKTLHKDCSLLSLCWGLPTVLLDYHNISSNRRIWIAWYVSKLLSMVGNEVKLSTPSYAWSKYFCKRLATLAFNSSHCTKWIILFFPSFLGHRPPYFTSLNVILSCAPLNDSKVVWSAQTAWLLSVRFVCLTRLAQLCCISR